MTAKSTTTTALILAAFALVGGAVIPTGVALSTTPVAAYAQLAGLGDIVDNTRAQVLQKRKTKKE